MHQAGSRSVVVIVRGEGGGSSGLVAVMLWLVWWGGGRTAVIISFIPRSHAYTLGRRGISRAEALTTLHLVRARMLSQLASTYSPTNTTVATAGKEEEFLYISLSMFTSAAVRAVVPGCMWRSSCWRATDSWRQSVIECVGVSLVCPTVRVKVSVAFDRRCG